MDKSQPPFVKRVVLKNFKSFKHCDVELGPLTVLVGPNGSGKSNFLDALDFVVRFLRDSLFDSVNVRRLMISPAYSKKGKISIELTLALPDGREAYYGLNFAMDSHEFGFELNEENCRITGTDSGEVEYCVKSGKVFSKSFETAPAVPPGRPYLTMVSGYPDFGMVHALLSSMSFFDIIPDEVRKLPMGSIPPAYISSGFGLNKLLYDMAADHPDTFERLSEFIRVIDPQVEKIIPGSFGESFHTPFPLGEGENVCPDMVHRLLVRMSSKNNAFYLPGESMSDGMLRALGILAALYRCLSRLEANPIPLVVIEEPETSLHPAAVAVLMDAMHEATCFTQVVATTQSPELLDYMDLDSDVLLVSEMGSEGTVIAAVDDDSRSIVRDGLLTLGELLKQSQLSPASDRSHTLSVNPR